MNLFEKAASMIQNSKYTVVLTGAGISTESGIPDFRSPGTGLWEKIDPMKALSTEVLYNDPQQFYRVGFELILSIKDAEPNKAHYMLTEMESAGIINLIITQNIDNLHIKAGSKRVFEVHGNTRTCTCIKCERQYLINQVKDMVKNNSIPPKCSCGGIIRPDVVLFGDMLPECFDKGVREVKLADLLIVIGSSLTVGPVNYLAGICKKLMILNIGDTPFDYRADIIIREKASAALENIMECLKSKLR